MSSRLTAAAKAFCFIFLRTLLACSPLIRSGRTMAAAVMKPVNSSQAYSVLSNRETRGQSGMSSPACDLMA